MKWDVDFDTLDIKLNNCISANYDGISMIRNIDLYKTMTDEKKFDLLLYKLNSMIDIIESKK